MITSLRNLVELWSRKKQEEEPAALLLGQSDEMVRLRNAVLHLIMGNEPSCLVVGIVDQGERDALAKGILRLAEAHGVVTVNIDGGWGTWIRQLDRGEPDARLQVVLGWHERQENEKLRQRIAEANLRIIFLWPIEKAGTTAAPPGVEQFFLDHLHVRAGDAACHLVGSILSNVANDSDAEKAYVLLDDAILDSLPALLRNGSNLDNHNSLSEAGRRVADLLRERIALRPNEPITLPELLPAVFPPSLPQPPASVRRLWVEGQTDKQLFEYVARRSAEVVGVDLLQGIEIQAIDGCSQVDIALRNCRAQKKLELFLFDADDDGRRAKQKVEEFGFDALTLSEDCVASACRRDWVLEDLVDVGALDRFHLVQLRRHPIREEISYGGERIGRRLIVDGEAKLQLVEWLGQFASLDELAGVVVQIQQIRRRFALPSSPVTRLRCPDRRGVRPDPWWFG